MRLSTLGPVHGARAAVLPPVARLVIHRRSRARRGSGGCGRRGSPPPTLGPIARGAPIVSDLGRSGGFRGGRPRPRRGRNVSSTVPATNAQELPLHPFSSPALLLPETKVAATVVIGSVAAVAASPPPGSISVILPLVAVAGGIPSLSAPVALHPPAVLSARAFPVAAFAVLALVLLLLPTRALAAARAPVVLVDRPQGVVLTAVEPAAWRTRAAAAAANCT